MLPYDIQTARFLTLLALLRSMEEFQSESGCVVGMECPLVQIQGSIMAAFDPCELPVCYSEESRLRESPVSDWQGTTAIGTPHISTVNSVCIREGSVDIEPQRDHGIVMASALAQRVLQELHLALLSSSFGTQKFRLYLMDRMYIAFLTCSCLLICQSKCANRDLSTGTEKIRTWYAR
jgi:hypothetical protein